MEYTIYFLKWEFAAIRKLINIGECKFQIYCEKRKKKVKIALIHGYNEGRLVFRGNYSEIQITKSKQQTDTLYKYLLFLSFPPLTEFLRSKLLRCHAGKL